MDGSTKIKEATKNPRQGLLPFLAKGGLGAAAMAIDAPEFDRSQALRQIRADCADADPRPSPPSSPNSGPRARAATAADAAAAGDLVVVTVPLEAYREVPVEPLRGKVVIDTNNYYPQRDGHIAELDDDSTTSSELLRTTCRSPAS